MRWSQIIRASMAIPQPPSRAAPHPDQGTWNHPSIPISLIRLSRASLIRISTHGRRRECGAVVAGQRATESPQARQ